MEVTNEDITFTFLDFFYLVKKKSRIVLQLQVFGNLFRSHGLSHDFRIVVFNF